MGNIGKRLPKNDDVEGWAQELQRVQTSYLPYRLTWEALTEDDRESWRAAARRIVESLQGTNYGGAK